MTNTSRSKGVLTICVLALCAFIMVSCVSVKKLQFDKNDISFPMTVGAAYRIAQAEIEKETSEYYISHYSEYYPDWKSIVDNTPIYYLDIHANVDKQWKNTLLTIDSLDGKNEFFPNQGKTSPSLQTDFIKVLQAENRYFSFATDRDKIDADTIVHELPPINYQLFALLTEITEKLDTDIQTLLLSKAKNPSFSVYCLRSTNYFITMDDNVMDDNNKEYAREVLSIEYDTLTGIPNVYERDYSNVTPTPQMQTPRPKLR